MTSGRRQACRDAKVRQTLEGLEKYCTRCKEWWPADVEFFWADPTGVAGLWYCCKACYHEQDRRPHRRGLVPLHAPIPDVFKITF